MIHLKKKFSVLNNIIFFLTAFKTKCHGFWDSFEIGVKYFSSIIQDPAVQKLISANSELHIFNR